MFLDEPRTATAVARSEAEALRIPYPTFQEALGREEPWALKMVVSMAQSLARRLSTLDQQLVSLTLELREAEAQGVPTPSSEAERLRERLFSHWAG